MRNILRKLHLYAGLVAAIFLVILGLTGTIMAFEGDIDHWLHPGVWYVKTAAWGAITRRTRSGLPDS